MPMAACLSSELSNILQIPNIKCYRDRYDFSRWMQASSKAHSYLKKKERKKKEPIT